MLLQGTCDNCAHTVEYQEKDLGDGILRLIRHGWVIEYRNHGLVYFCPGCVITLKARRKHVAQMEDVNDDDEDEQSAES